MTRRTPEQQIAKAEETIRRASKKLRDQDRKIDTRRKIVLGATLLRLAETDPKAERIIKALVLRMSDRDQELF